MMSVDSIIVIVVRIGNTDSVSNREALIVCGRVCSDLWYYLAQM